MLPTGCHYSAKSENWWCLHKINRHPLMFPSVPFTVIQYEWLSFSPIFVEGKMTLKINLIWHKMRHTFNDTWLVLWENRPLWGLKERFTHPCVTIIILWASFQADIFWLPNEFLLLMTPNMHAFFNISTNWGGFRYAKITLFFNPEEGDFLTTRVTYAPWQPFKENKINHWSWLTQWLYSITIHHNH